MKLDGDWILTSGAPLSICIHTTAVIDPSLSELDEPSIVVVVKSFTTGTSAILAIGKVFNITGFSVLLLPPPHPVNINEMINVEVILIVFNFLKLED